MKKYLIILSVLMCLSLVSAWSNTTFNNSLTTENLTYTSDSNLTRYLQVPQGITFYAGTGQLNLSGYAYGSLNFYDRFNRSNGAIGNTWNVINTGAVAEINSERMKLLDTGGGQSLDISKNVTPFTNGTITYTNLSFYNSGTTIDIRLNLYNDTYGLRIIKVNGNLTWLNESGNNIIISEIENNVWINLELKNINVTSNSYDIYLNDTLFTSNANFSNNIDQIDEFSFICGTTASCNYFIDDFNISYQSIPDLYPSEMELIVNSAKVFNYSTSFNHTNNRTSNFRNDLNNYLIYGCNYINQVCEVPLIFRSSSIGILEYSDLGFSSSSKLIVNDETHLNTVLEGTEQNYRINISYDPNFYTQAYSNITYNGTKYGAEIISQLNHGNFTNVIFEKNITVPNINSDTTKFYTWEVVLINSTDEASSSFSYEQNITQVSVAFCNSTFNHSFINFTIFDSELYTLVNSSFKMDLDVQGSIFSYNDTSETNSSFAFCFSPPENNYTISATIQYDSSDHANNYYYLNDYVLNNETTNITLYLLNSSQASTTVLKVQSNTQTPLKDVYISIQKYDPGTSSSFTVAMAKTDFNGEDVVYLNWYDTFYQYNLVQNGELILSTDLSKVSESPVDFNIPVTTTYDYDKFQDIAYSLTFNNITNNFVLTYSIPSGDVTAGCLRVTKRSASNDTTICNTCESSSSATIYCNVDSYGNGTYFAQFYALGSLGYIDSITEFIGTVNAIYDAIGNDDATFYAFFFAALCFSLFFITPMLGVLGILAGIGGGIALGFQPLNYMEFVGIIIVGGIIIILLGKR